MALRMKKDIKKASYYVWFLGAQESKGLRGDEYALPAIRYLEQRARDLEPFKVTLQVSHKGLKIIQNVQSKGKQQTIKHFIPHGSITSAVVQEDVVACVLLLYNPLTGCPVHVHAYRCDSEHTAEMLFTHLQALIDRPENQKKFADIERKLQMRGALPQSKKPPDSSLGSEVSTRESDSGSNEERCVANLYDSLAAELKQKLSTGKRGIGKSPILLPPRDYDTVHRQKGNLSNIDTRRCLNQNIVGVNARRKLESSGGSSGIGSDLAPSPERNDYSRQHDNHSTSEEDWAESTAYLMHEAFDASPQRHTSPPRRSSPPRGASPRRALSPRRYDQGYDERDNSYRDQLAPFRDQVFTDRRFHQESLERVPKSDKEQAFDRRFHQESLERISKNDKEQPFDRRFIQETLERVPKSDKEQLFDRRFHQEPQDRVPKSDKEQAFDRRFHQESLELIPKIDKDQFDRRFRQESIERIQKSEKDKYGEDVQYRRRYIAEPKQSNRSIDRGEERSRRDRNIFPSKLQRGASEGSLKVADNSPKDRFNVAKEKFMNLERERFNRELEQHMAIRRSMLERNSRSTSSPEEDIRDERQDRQERQERPHREIERLPRVGRKRDDVNVKRYEYGSEDFLDKPKRRDEVRYRERRELDRRIEEDEIIEPVLEERPRRDWNDRQRAFSRSRLLEDQRQSYAEPERPYYDRDYRDFRDLTDRDPTKFRHSYAEPIPRGRLGTVRPY